MRKILLLVILVNCSCSNLFSQLVQATIKKSASSQSSVVIAIKPDANVNARITNYQFTLQVPATGNGSASIEVTNNHFSQYITTFDLKSYTDGGYVNFLINGKEQSGSPTASLTGGTEYDVLEVKFANGTATPSQVRLAQLPGGGNDPSTPAQYNFYWEQGGDLTNYTNPFYGTGASNAGDGVSYSYVSVDGILLPVNWLSFTASLKGSGAELNWSAEEKNSKNFEITRSLDGTKFTTINLVASKGNGTNSYTYTDEAVTKIKTQGDIFYQLIQVDKDGKRNPSAVRTVRISLPEGGISVSPNPVINIATGRFNHPKEEKATLRITDANGKVVYQQATQVQKGYNQKDINLSAISKGNYNLSVVSGSANKTIQLVKAGQ